MTQPPELSVVIPLFNEEANVGPVVAELVAALDSHRPDFEILLVDDGSKDGTLRAADSCARRDQRIKLVRLRRNYGQTAAMAAGIAISTGRVLVTMDGDQQNDPADIETLLTRLDGGCDVVVGWRRARKDPWLTRRVPSIVANGLISMITGIRIHDNGCTLKAFRGSLIRKIPLYSEMHRFIPAMASIAGARIGEVEVKHRPRRRGVSKYGLGRTYRVLLDIMSVQLISRFASRPSFWFGLLAVPFALAGLTMLSAQLLAVVLTGTSLSLPIAGSATLFVSLAIILVMSGILAELTYGLGEVRDEQFAMVTAQATPHRAPRKGSDE